MAAHRAARSTRRATRSTGGCVNFTELDHPMHLHGFYFRTDSKGNGVTDSLYTPSQRRMGVTEIIQPFQTMSLSWVADAAGQLDLSLPLRRRISRTSSRWTPRTATLDTTMLKHHMSDRPHQMFGLVMGISVAPNGPSPAPRRDAARRSGSSSARSRTSTASQSGMSFVLDGTPEAADPDALPVPGPTLVLERGKRVAVTIVNQSQDPPRSTGTASSSRAIRTACRGGADRGRTSCRRSLRATRSRCAGRRRAPARSCTTRTSTKRSRWAAGCTARSSCSSRGSASIRRRTRSCSSAPPAPPPIRSSARSRSFVMNGKTQPEAMNLKAGTRYRFRLFNLAGDTPLMVSLSAGDAPIDWRAGGEGRIPAAAVAERSRGRRCWCSTRGRSTTSSTRRPPRASWRSGSGRCLHRPTRRRHQRRAPAPGSPPPPTPPPTITVPIHVR